MSRNINTTKTTLTSEEMQLRSTDNGKLLFTKYKCRNCALLIQGTRLIAARFFPDAPSKIGAVYIGKVKNIAKNIDACFVEIADHEICFLPMKEAKSPFLLNRVYDGRILEGDELLVQITKDAQKNKQTSVTAHISLANEAFAISVGIDRISYSGKLSKEQKEQLSQLLEDKGILKKGKLILQNGQTATPSLPPLGLVVRTHAASCDEQELLNTFRDLEAEIYTLFQTATHRTCYSCLKEPPAAWQTVFDHLVYPYEYQEIVTDSKSLYKQLIPYLEVKLPDKPVRLYEDTIFNLAKLYSLDSKIDTALNARIWLKSGAYLIIEPTEALTVIDVNSGKYEVKRASADFYYQVNCEAAEEIALQLRLRNLSGIIVVDFINMSSPAKEQELLEYLRTLVKKDKQKTLVVDITPLGLVEITRKKESKPLAEQLSGNSVK